MITINLRPGLKRKRPGAGKAQILAQLRELGTKIKDPLLLAAGAAWVIAVGWLGWFWLSAKRDLSALQPRYEQVREEQKRFQNLMDQKRRAERIRDSLLAQIGVIRAVDGDRYVWPHILDEVAKALPAYTWLVGIRMLSSAAPADSADTLRAPLQFEVQGRTVDIQAYTRLLRQLEASPWIENATALEVKQLVESERPVTGFTVRANFKRADSAYVKTVPLSQSVR